MMLCMVQILQELLRTEKTLMYNCFTTNADLNVLLDANTIIVTLNSMFSNQCNIPHGVFVSLQIDSLGTYEPNTYVLDFMYKSATQTINVDCNIIDCSNIKSTQSATIVLETKTSVTYIPVGSIRVSRGLADQCFHDDDSYVELYQGSVVAVLYPTYNCFNIISSNTAGVDNLLPISSAKAYIDYSDDTNGVFEQLQISIEAGIFLPTLQFSKTDTPLRIRLSNPKISEFFLQSMSNGVMTKNLKIIQIGLTFLLDTAFTMKIKKTAQTTLNYYKLMGIPYAYSKFDMKIVNNGFYVTKAGSPQLQPANQLLNNLGVTGYIIEYIFTTYSVSGTDTFRYRLMSPGVVSGQNLLSLDVTQTTCEVRFPNQGCATLMPKLRATPIKELKAYLVFYFQKDQEVLQNYTINIDNIFDSCFSDGVLDYSKQKSKLMINISSNAASKTCTISKNDAISVVITNAISKQQLATLNIDYKTNDMYFEIDSVVLDKQPEIRVQFFRDLVLQDAISLTQYVENYDYAPTQTKEIIIVSIILAVNLAITIVYILIKFLLYPYITSHMLKTQVKVQRFVTAAEEEVDV
ncbi:Conserved_hypothetical protein [Hexamita inflata]|uniref:Uncharacterized protein n=1 Tax=Hexamita inflata TaxID=28002 RepID=A0AA86NWY0_9EUKA|nr:Conserved hypothetical protein [Hexamita inflata]